VEPGLVDHSDRGAQYASGDCTELLQESGIVNSMSRKGNPWDNAACEAFMKTLKYEEVHRSDYRDLAEARSAIREFPEKVYNHKRLHSSLSAMCRRQSLKRASQHNRQNKRRPLRGNFIVFIELKGASVVLRNPSQPLTHRSDSVAQTTGQSLEGCGSRVLIHPFIRPKMLSSVRQENLLKNL
jgi:hypothetical protein